MRSIIFAPIILTIVLFGCERSITAYQTISIFSADNYDIRNALNDGGAYNLEGLIVRADGMFFIANNEMQPLVQIHVEDDSILYCLRFAEQNVDRFRTAILGLYLDGVVTEIVAIEIWGEQRQMLCSEGQVTEGPLADD